MHVEPAPDRLARQAQLVQPRRDRSEPRARAGARAPTRPRRPRSPAAARSPRRSPSRPCSCVPGRTCCQANRKRISRRGGHGLDLAAQPVQRAAVDAREQPPIAPLHGLPFCRPRREATAEDTALQLDRAPAPRRRRRGQSARSSARARAGGRADQRKAGAHQLDQRAFAIGPGGGATSGRLDHVRARSGGAARPRRRASGARPPPRRRGRRRGRRAARRAAISSSR